MMYPSVLLFLIIAIKKVNPTSPAFTAATTLSPSTEPLNTLLKTTIMQDTSNSPETEETNILDETTSKTTSTVSSEPLTTIQAHPSQEKTTGTLPVSTPTDSTHTTTSNIQVTETVNLIYMSSNLTGYKRSRVNAFTSGSIKVDMTLIFENTSIVPSSKAVETILSAGAVNITMHLMAETVLAGEIVNLIPVAPVTVQSSTGIFNFTHAMGIKHQLSCQSMADTQCNTGYITKVVLRDMHDNAV
ncbi:hypothetical protein DNTS_020820 [Danionella cerebrum]|uniref:SEA domain-containing protein n=1 Tax=Danionella cerebrum TaxID=2873325 RepID=A0A553RBF1_9TELE|nr:hypothetical protein DNTS_020820 [Danionella translucida]